MYRLKVALILSVGVVGLAVGNGWSGMAEKKEMVGLDPRGIAVIANRDSSDLTLIDLQTDKVVGRIALAEFTNPHMAMMTMDGKKILVSGTGKDQFVIIDVATRRIEKVVETGQGPEHFDITRDNRFAYVGNMGDSTLSVVDLQKGAETTRLAGFFEPHGFSVLPDDSKVLVSNFGAHEVGVVKTETTKLAKRLAVGNVQQLAAQNPSAFLTDIKGIANPTLTPDGRYAYAADGDSGEVAVIDTKSEKVIKKIQVGKEPWRAYASPDGKWMLVPNNGDETVSVIDTTLMAVVTTLKGGPGMTGVNFANGDKAYIISRGDSTLYVYDLKTFNQVNRLKIGARLALETAATTGDGMKIYLASSTDDAVYVIETATDKIKQIPNVGRFPWGVSILGAGSANYCH